MKRTERLEIKKQTKNGFFIFDANDAMVDVIWSLDCDV
jgi:hypothetical protein